MTIHKAFTSYGKRFFMLPAVVTAIIACCGSLPPQLLWRAPFIIRFAYQQTSNQGLPVPRVTQNFGRPGDKET